MADKFKPYFKATTEKKDGKVHWEWDAGEAKLFNQYLESLQYKEAKTKIKITVERYRNDASTQQMRYLFGVVYAVLGDFFGYDRYEYEKYLHRPLKKMFLGYKVVEEYSSYRIFKDQETPMNTQVVELVSLKDIDTGRMTDFIEDVRRWAMKEYSVHIPAPNEIDYDELPDTLPEF